MKTKFYKTEHFIYRQWDRGIDDDSIERIVKEIEPCNKKSLIIIGSENFKKYGLGKSKNRNLIIIQKGKALLTLFFVKDLYNYLKSQSRKLNSIIL